LAAFCAQIGFFELFFMVKPKRCSTQPKLYNPRHPERTLLYQTVCEHYETWLDLASAGQFDGQGDHYTPKPYVRKAFAKYSAMATTPAGSGHQAHRLLSFCGKRQRQARLGRVIKLQMAYL
jgi:hypothetical protein